MKKILLFVSALAGLFLAASCQQENLEPVAGNGQVTFTVEAPAVMQTKAIANGMNVNELIYEVWITSAADPTNLVGKERLFQGKETMFHEDGKNKAKVTLDLVNDQHYTVLFWAQVKEEGKPAAYITEKLTEVKYAKGVDQYLANDESLAAFYAVNTVNDGVPGSSTVYLKRPFAQVNLCTFNKRDVTNTVDHPGDYNVAIVNSKMTLKKVPTQFNVATSEATEPADFSFVYNVVPSGEDKTIEVNSTKYYYAGMNYVFAGDNLELTYDIQTSLNGSTNYAVVNNVIAEVPVKENYRTNIIGNLLTSKTYYEIFVDAAFDDNNYAGDKYGVIDGKVYVKVADVTEFNETFANGTDIIVLNADINLSEVATRAGDVSLQVKGRELVIDLNGHTLSAISTQSSTNYNLFDVNGGTLTVKNGTIAYKHEGENMGWNASTNIFNVTAGGVLNLNGVTAENQGGSDMGFVAHLNNWGEVTLNVENSTLVSNYVAVRVFNSGPHMNNVDIKNSTLKGGSYAFWVHNYTVEDFGSEAKAEAQKALLNLNIYGQGNTFSPDVNGIRYGFTNSVKSDANGVTKVVSEDGTEVTLGALVEDAVIRRGVAGAEENTTIKKVVVEEGVAVLYDRTFRRFYALETVVLPSTLTTIGAAGSGVFQSCTNLKNIVLPESVTVLGKGTFQECSSLESINIPAGVTRIESDALRATGLKSVVFHEGVTYFGAQAFRDCKQLTEVVINAPEFTMESNTFGVMAAPYPTMTIYVANQAMKTYVESKLTTHAKTYITVVAPEVVDNAEALAAACAEGKNVILNANLTDAPVQTKAPYGNYYGVKMVGGVLDGNGNTLDFDEGPRVNGKADNYGIMISAGTIKNLKLSGVFRSVVIMNPTDDITIDNVVFDPEDEWGNCYPINTAEGDGTHNLYVNNCVIAGWNSYGSAIKNLYITNSKFVQGSYYTNVYGRLSKPYVTTVYENCDFCSKYYIDLSSLGKDNAGKLIAPETKVTLKNCSVNGVKLTAENWTSLVAPEDSCGEGQISIELRDGSYLTAGNIADYVIFE